MIEIEPKMSIYDKRKPAKDSFDLYPQKNQRNSLISLKMRYGIVSSQ